MSQTPDVLVSTSGACTTFTLSRPKALNALTLPMVRSLTEGYTKAAADPAVRCLLVEGEGGKAFCAGGDVRAVWEAGRVGGGGTASDGEVITDAFFREEYALNAAIAGSPKPQVSVWDGIVMGGGVGVSVHGAFRVATEKAMFAMPETNIGLFPDVGGSHFLSLLPGELGTYIGLTGQRLSAADLIYCGLATHHVPSQAMPELGPTLASCASADDVEAALARLGRDAELQPGESHLARARAEIDAAFAYDTMEEVVAHLQRIGEREPEGFGAKTLATLLKLSPTSLKITLRLLREARAGKDGPAPLTACLVREFRVVQRCVTPPSDFFEGIRAALVDKDRNPQWSPSSLEQVSAQDVDAYFAPLGAQELTIGQLPGFSVP